MMRADALTSHGYPIITGMTATKQIPSSHGCSADKRDLKEFHVNETLLQSCSTDKEKSKGIIVNETILQRFSTD